MKTETRQQILSVAEELGYHGRPRVGRPRREAARQQRIVEVVTGLVGNQEHPFDAGLIAALERELKGHGYDCLLRTCSGSYEAFLGLTETLAETAASGTIVTGHFTPPQLRALLDLQPRALLVDNPGHPDIEATYGYVAFDNTEVGRLATQHLLSIGRERILLLAGQPDHFFSAEIEQGWRDAHRRAGLEPDENLIRYGDYTAEHACDAMAAILEEGLDIDAVFTNDEMGCGVLQALHAHRLRVPEDIAVVGCDGLPMSARVYPRLTTVVLDYDELAHQAVAMLSTTLNDRREAWRCRLVPRLLIRESSQLST